MENGDTHPHTLILSILIVDDELNIRKTLGLALETEGHRVSAVSNTQDALSEVTRLKFDMVFLDIRLGTASGIDLIVNLLEKSPWLKIVMITAFATIDTAVEAMKRGAYDYIAKPFTTAQIFAVTRKVQEIRILEGRITDLEQELAHGVPYAELKSHSPSMQRALNLAREVAATDVTILITGENGTGKGLLAQAIHYWSKRSHKNFSVISCPALSAELLESELFGHAKGAFTGAIRHNPGRIMASEGGTLFLDEIGDLPISLQPKLLRFVQDRQFEHIGEQLTRTADVRIIAATNIDLDAAVKAKRFREDLLYRLNVIQIELPPLRERVEDIIVLAERFLAAFREGKPIIGFSEGAVALLKNHRWPGNVRQLRNVIERAVILCREEFIDSKHLTLQPQTDPPPHHEEDLLSLDQVEEIHIRRVLAASRSMEDAARILAIDPATLWRRRKKYGI